MSDWTTMAAAAKAGHGRFGRREGCRLLELSAEVKDSIDVPVHDPLEPLVAYAVWTLRGRDLLRATYRLADADLVVESGIVARALLETMIVMNWVSLDGFVNLRSWYLSDLKKERKWENSWQKAAQDPRWQHPDGLPPERVARTRELIDELTKEGVKDAPNIEQMAASLHLFDAYPIMYRLYSGFTHGSTTAVLDYMADRKGEEWRVTRASLSDPHMNPNPYWMPAVIFVRVLRVASDRLGFDWREEVDRIDTTLRAGS